jgi:hypothetical protein
MNVGTDALGVKMHESTGSDMGSAFSDCQLRDSYTQL